MTNIWHKEQSAVQDTSSKDAVISKFVERDGEAVTLTHRMTIKSSLNEIAEGIVGFLKENKITATLKSDESSWVGVDGGEHLVAIIGYDNRSRYDAPSYDGFDEEIDEGNELFGNALRIFTVTAAGNRVMLRALLTYLHGSYKARKYAQIKWWYKEGGRATYKISYMEPLNTMLRPEFYPTLGDPHKFINDYLKSDASILLMAGEPGTGKTTLLRHMLYDNDLTASVVFDEELMESDNVFQNFLFDKENNVLIIEDADKILTSREADKNKLMSRFLNISDGLIKLPNKKLIFTTNVTDFTKVDEALMRPGRCFASVHTRPLTFEEAQKAAKAAGLSVPVDGREYSLADLFNIGPKIEARRIGFVR